MNHYRLLLLLVPIILQGQTTETDTISVKNLQEVIVVADNQYIDATKTVYIPTTVHRTTAYDGVTLLARMNIPQLSVNQHSGTIKTTGGQPVKIFINFKPASAEDVEGLNPSDVRRVEYMDFPADPCFLRADHVVNFVTKEYSYGGYTKLNGKEKFIINTGEASLYSKFVYRRMEYDFMLYGDYESNPFIGSAGKDLYKFRSGTIIRESDTETGKLRKRGLFTGLRLSWSNEERISFRNIISFRVNNTPVHETSGNVWFNETYSSEKYISTSSEKNVSIRWGSELFLKFEKGWSIFGELQSEWLNGMTKDSYKTAISDIENHADEKTRFVSGDIQTNKTLSDKISLFSKVSLANNRSVINYIGTSNTTNRFHQAFSGLCVGISIKYHKVSGTIDAGIASESNHINGLKMDDSYPFTHINLQYTPNKKHSLSLWSEYATMSPVAVMKNPNIIRQSEHMYICGNPALKGSRTVTGNISYIFFADNRWQLASYATLFRISGRQIEVYSPSEQNGMMMKKYQNDGDYNHGQTGAKLTGNFLNGKLTVSAASRLLIYKTTGSNSISHYPLTASVNADYSQNNFYFNIYWGSQTSYVDGETSYLRRIPSAYSLSVGWASKGWNIRISGENIFRKSRIISMEELHSEWFDSNIIQFGSDSSRKISVTVNYTFNYGKKVDRTGELSGDMNISTSILR